MGTAASGLLFFLFNMSKDNTISIKDALNRFIDHSNLRKKLDEHKLIEHWEEFVGEHIKAQTKEISIKNNKLYIKTESSVVRQELGFMKTRLLNLINRKFGAGLVDEIILL
jgi:predicted nucleic acid-binding Zn ribbon protein